MKYKSEIRLRQQAGFGLIIGVFIIVIMAMLVASMVNFSETETQAGSTELMSLRAFEAASSLSEFGLRQAMTGEKCVILLGAAGCDCDDAANVAAGLCEYRPFECDAATEDDVSFASGDPDSNRMPGGTRQWQDDYMGFCEALSLQCEETKIGVNGVTGVAPTDWVADSYFVVKGTVKCAVTGDTDEVYSVERFTVETGAKLTATEKLDRNKLAACRSKTPGKSGKDLGCEKTKKVK